MSVFNCLYSLCTLFCGLFSQACHSFTSLIPIFTFVIIIHYLHGNNLETDESKAKLEAMKRPGFKGKELLPRPESPKNKTRSLVSPNKKMIPRAAQKVHVLCSFEPDPILESEERERLSGLSQRDFLIRNYGILEKVYFAMLRNGTLRADDEKKYGARLRKDPFQDINPKDINVSHSQKAPIISK